MVPRTNTPIHEVRAGMTVNGDVFDRSGRLLISSGTCLTAKHLRILKMWGVLEIPLCHTPQSQEPPVEHAPHIDEIEQQLTAAFRNTDLSQPFMHELFRLCVERHQSKGVS